MQLPTLLSRNKKLVHKNSFGHLLVLAGSQRMLGAAGLVGLSAMRTGAGLVTLGVAKSLNTALQKKINNCLMTWPLPETKTQSISSLAYKTIENKLSTYACIAIGPGLSTDKSTVTFIYKIIRNSPVPVIIDADALNAVSLNIDILKKAKSPLILTPHPKEMARLINVSTTEVEENRKKTAQNFANQYNVTLLLKGANTAIAHPTKRTIINKTGNPGMATAGSGDVLTGMIAALVTQGLNPDKATTYGAYLHGKAGDLAAQSKTRISMIASDIIDNIPKVFRNA